MTLVLFGIMKLYSQKLLRECRVVADRHVWFTTSVAGDLLIGGSSGQLGVVETLIRPRWWGWGGW